MKKILFLSNTANFSKFNIPYMRWFKEQGWRVDYCSAGEETVSDCDNQYSISIARTPFSLTNLRAYKELKKILYENQYDILHCHTPMGGVIGRLAADKLHKQGKIKIIYTAHGFHFYKGAPLFNWLAYYPVERWLAGRTDVLITINGEDYDIARKFNAGEVFYVPGVGIDVAKFSKKAVSRSEMREKLGLSDSDFVLLSVGELIVRKNHSLVLKVLGDLKQKGKLGNLQYLICGCGVLENELKKKACELGIADIVHFLGYRNDVNEIYNAADLFIFVSLQEGLPVALMESMASGVPVICSNIRGNTDLIENGKNGEIIENNASALTDALEKLKEDGVLRERYAREAASTITGFDISLIKEKMENIYLQNF